MNQFTLLVIILVVFTYYGGSNVPKVLKDNKELLLGVVVGLVLCSFLGMRLEGVTGDECEEQTGRLLGQELHLHTEQLCNQYQGEWRNGKCCVP